MSWIKILLVNVLLFFSLIGMLLLSPPILNSLYQLVKPEKPKIMDTRSTLEIYNNFKWANIHFNEFYELSTTYYDYISWRRNDYSGETININNGIRTTINPFKTTKETAKYFFFGGSTTWGVGVNDINTYPSIFSRLTRSDVTNFGETAYIARQSLAYLNNYIINNSLSTMSNINVIFYDGINDVAHRCRSEINGLGTVRENQIQNKLKVDKRFSFDKTFLQFQEFINKLMHKFISKKVSDEKSESYYDCASNEKRALEIATSLVDTWEFTSEIVTALGGKFTAVLQPVAYYGSPNINYLNLTSSNDKALAAQFKAVYPLIIKIASQRNFNFFDLTRIYNGCNDCYIDFCHVGPQGHQILVSKLISNLKIK